MSCRYLLKGREFKSEIALDEFILNNIDLFNPVTDIVYAKTTNNKNVNITSIQNQRRKKLLNSDKQVLLLYKEGRIRKKLQITNYSDSKLETDKPYIGTTEFIKSFKNADGIQLVPVYIEDNYFGEKKKLWESDAYWKSADPEEILEIFKGEKPHAITTKEEFERIKNYYKEKWELQSLLGTSLHNIFKVYWRASPTVKHNRNKLKEEIKKELDKKLQSNKAWLKKKTYLDFYSDDLLEIAIDHCYGLDSELRNTFGQNYKVLSEVGLMSITSDELGKSLPIVGVADLIVIDEKGNINILDYKTSPKEYGNYNDAKKRTFYYQLAIYQRMVERLGINLTADSGVYVIPLLFENFKYDDINKKVSFTGIQSVGGNIRNGKVSKYLEELPIKVGSEANVISRNINEFLPLPKLEDTTSEDLMDKIHKLTKEWFSQWGVEDTVTDEDVWEAIKKRNAHVKDKDTNKYHYKYGSKELIADTDKQLFSLVKKEFMHAKNYMHDSTVGIKRQLKEGLKTGAAKFYGNSKVGRYGSEEWLENNLSKYCNSNWTVLEGPASLEHLGIILLQNIHTRQIDVIKISSATWQDLNKKILLGGSGNNKMHLLSGNFENDILQKQRPKELMLESCYGNIELMQTMAIIDSLPNLFSNNQSVVGNVTVMKPGSLDAITASNEELIYSYKELRKLSGKDKSNFELDNIKLLPVYEIVKFKFQEILGRVNSDKNWVTGNNWKDFSNAATVLDLINGNPILMREKLLELADKLESKFKLLKAELAHYSESDHPERSLYYNIHLAISEIDGVKYRQLLEDHSKYLQNVNIFDKGLSGTYIDNPGNMDSDTLNKVSLQVNIAYQNTRNDIQALKIEMDKALSKFKKAKHFTYLKSNTFWNVTSIYQNLYIKTENDLKFKNPWDKNALLDAAEREFLMFCLKVINRDRLGCITEEDFVNRMSEYPERFFQVPLTFGSTSSRLASEGFLKVAKDKFAGLNPKNWLQRIREREEGYLEEDNTYSKAALSELWEMTNTFDAGNEPVIRLRIIAKLKSVDVFELNLEYLTLKHAYAYSLKKNMDKVFPTIKTAMLHLSMQGIILNDKFINDIEYLSDYIKAKIFNLNITDSKYKSLSYLSGKIMGAASKLALAFNPRLLYLHLDGIWKAISLVYRLHDQDPSFTFKNMKDSFLWIYRDLIRMPSEKPSLGEAINNLYGINDRDMNTYIEKIKLDRFGIYNFWNVGFIFASRPDYYNRMAIFGAQMRGDGCFEAHYLDKDGRLIYDCTKDKRFNLLWDPNGKQNIEEYNKQKGLYIAVAKLFVAEHAKNDDGTEFILDLSNDNNLPKLPRAYTTQQSESMKSLSDMIYGYYSHEKKSLIQSLTAGSLFMQMNTYWSSKKNQWLASGGIKSRGSMQQYEEIDPETKQVVKYWLKMDPDTKEVSLEPTKDPASGIPYMVWKGDWEEGILLTLSHIGKDTFLGTNENLDSSNIFALYNYYYNHPNETLRKSFRNNLRLLWYDLFMYLLLGLIVTPALVELVKKDIKEKGNASLGQAMANDASLNLVYMLKSSADDFNAFKAIGGKGILWTPFAISSTTNQVENISNFISGNRDLYDTLVKTAAATKTQEPLWDFIKINTLGREIGDNGKD